MSDQLKLPNFSKPVARDEAVKIYANWHSGDPMNHVANNFKISTKKVSEIITHFPREWLADVTQLRKSGNNTNGRWLILS